MDQVNRVEVSAGTSLSAAAVSWFIDTLPVVQWTAAAVAILSGLLACLLGVTKLIDWYRKQ